MGAAQALRDLVGEHGVPASAIQIEWGAVVRGEMCKMPPTGGMLALGDRIYVKVTSQAESDLYIHILNIGLAGSIMLMTANVAPGGVPLRSAGSAFVLGQGADGTLDGLGLAWPGEIPRGVLPRLDQIVVIATSTSVSLRSLETGERSGAARGLGSELQNLLSQAQDGLPRSLTRAETPDGHYMQWLSYYLCPQDAGIADIPFVIDDSPPRQALVCDGEAWVAGVQPSIPASDRSGMITIRLVDFVVEDQALSSGARLDALICTRSTNDRAFATWTSRDLVAQDTLFHGEVHDFVEVFLWASEDRGGLALEQLLAQRGDRAVIADATNALSFTSCAPRVMAVAASAALARASDDLLAGATEHCYGLYRCSFRCPQLGPTRIPAIGAHHARGLSFTLLVDPVAEPAGD
jgi:hypothetical protein